MFFFLHVYSIRLLVELVLVMGLLKEYFSRKDSICLTITQRRLPWICEERFVFLACLYGELWIQKGWTILSVSHRIKTKSCSQFRGRSLRGVHLKTNCVTGCSVSRIPLIQPRNEACFARIWRKQQINPSMAQPIARFIAPQWRLGNFQRIWRPLTQHYFSISWKHPA